MYEDADALFVEKAKEHHNACYMAPFTQCASQCHEESLMSPPRVEPPELPVVAAPVPQENAVVEEFSGTSATKCSPESGWILIGCLVAILLAFSC